MRLYKIFILCILVFIIMITYKPESNIANVMSESKKIDSTFIKAPLDNTDIIKANQDTILDIDNENISNNHIKSNDAALNNNTNKAGKELNTIVLKLKDINEIDSLNISEESYSTYSNIGTVTIEVPQGTNPDEIIEKYKNNLNVEEAYIDEIAELYYIPSDPYYSNQWNMQRLNMESAWDSSQGDSSVIIAVLDTGVGPFTDLDGYVNGADTSGSLILEDTYPGQYSYEGSYHGTAVASVIASNLNDSGIAGIAPNVSIMPVKVLPDGATTVGTTQIAAGIRWAADHGADFINLSLGSDYGTTVLEQAVSYAASKGVMIISASGNDGYVSHISYPAAYNNVIAVGSTGMDDTVSDFSNEGVELDLVAPGEEILLAFYPNSYAYMDGTSFSSPEVCALASLIKSKYPNYSNDMIKSILYVSTDDILDEGWDSSSGYGLINAQKAMMAAGDATLLDNNDTITNAENIVANKDYKGKNFPLNDNDYYKFTLYESYTVNITVTPSGTQDMVLNLYNSSSGLVTTEDATLSGQQEILTYQLGAGDYYVNAYDYSGDVYSTDYNINVQLNDTTPPVISAYQDGIPITSEIPTLSYLNAEIYDTSNFNITVTRDNISYDWPQDGLFTQDGYYIITATDAKNNTSSFDFTINSQMVSVRYRTHVQDYGWQNFVSDGAMSGTSGQSKRLEGINIEVIGGTNLGVKYKTQVQDYGWQDYVYDGTLSGTLGKSKRLEAIKIELTGTDAELYNIYYRVHAQDYGWLDWAKNGEAAGTEGLSKRLEGIEIKIVAKGEDPGLTTNKPFVSVYGTGNIIYKTHVQDYGWQNFVSDGAMSGTSGQSKRLESISIRLGVNLPAGSVVYTTHVQDYGWLSQVSNGTMSGTSGQSKRLEAIRINLTGEIANQYDIYYRVHAQNVGWMGWAKNGQDAGTAGFSYRLEGIEVRLVTKGGSAPGSTESVFIQK